MNRLPRGYLCIFFCFILTLPLRATGIILADEARQKALFNQSADSVLAFADSLSVRYNRVIIHLGQRFVFERGNIFSSPQSKRNLQLFCNRIRQNKGEVILWFLDSFGSEKFKEVHKIHKELIQSNMDSIRALEIPYNGIAVDLEWINLPRGNNNSAFAELIKTLRETIGNDKKLCYFATLTNNDNENIKRGYHTELLTQYAATPLAMLYVVENGFTVKKGRLTPVMSENRAKTLLNHYQKQKWEICYSMHRTWYVSHRRKAEEVSLTDMDRNRLVFRKNEEIDQFLSASYHSFPEKTEVKSKKDKTVKIKHKDHIIRVEAKKPDIKSDYFIWEYFDFYRN